MLNDTSNVHLLKKKQKHGHVHLKPEGLNSLSEDFCFIDEHCIANTKESLYIEEPMRQQINLVILGYRIEFD